MKRIITVCVSTILGIVAVVSCCHEYKYCTKAVTQKSSLYGDIGIRVKEYRFYTKSDYYQAEGVVRIENSGTNDMRGNPLFRVIVRDDKGIVHSMQRYEDVMVFEWTPFLIAAGSSFEGQFDGVLKFKNKPSEFAVRWDGNTNVVTDWIRL
jgi:hypothetical protein